MASVPPQGHARRVDRLNSRDGVTFDARHLHEARHGVAGESQGVLHCDFRGVLDLLGASSQRLGQAGSSHRRGGADLALAADFGSSDGGVCLDERPDRGRCE